MIGAREEAVRRHFEDGAHYWEQLYTRSDPRDAVYRRRLAVAQDIIRDLGLPHGTRALEVGSGAGAMSVHLAAAGCVVDAVDPAPAMVRMTRDRALRAATRVSVRQGDAHRLAFDDDSFGLVVALGVFPWLHQPRTAARELARVTRPGGWVVVTADNAWRLAELLDPLRSPLGRPVRGALKRLLGPLGLRRPSAARLAERHSPRAFRRLFAGTGLRVVEATTVGFQPFTFLHLRPRSWTPLERGLQRLADRRVPLIRSLGSQYVLVLRAEDVAGCGS